MKFDKDPLAIEQNNYLTKIVNVYIVYDLDTWPKNLGNVLLLIIAHHLILTMAIITFSY